MSANALDAAKALGIVSDYASRFYENAEEQFPRRLSVDDSDETLAALVDNDPDELQEAIGLRDLARALETIKMIYDQKGCEHFGRDCPDGKLTTLIDTVVFG